MQYPDLVWTALGIIGGYLLIKEEDLELQRVKWGVGLIIGSFLFQTYWELATKPTGGSILGVNSNIVGVTIIVIIDGLLLVWPGWLRKRVSNKKNNRGKV